MENEYSLNETVQAQVGEFRYLYVNGKEITFQEPVDPDPLDPVDPDPLDGEIYSLSIGWSNTDDPENPQFVETINLDGPTGFVTANNFYAGDYNLVDIGDANVQQAVSISNLDQRVSALEGASFDSSIVDNLSTSVQALQTRIGTLESLITLFTNNNDNDTTIEHRLTTLEKKITAIKALYDAKRAVYNMPLDW